MTCERPERVALVGAGRVGTSLALALHHSGVEVTAVVDMDLARAQRCAALSGAPVFSTSCSDIPAQSSMVVVTVPDDAIEKAATTLLSSSAARPGATVLHTSGALTSEALAPLRRKGASVASAHPVMTFSGHEDDWHLWQGTYVGIEGDEDARARAETLFRRLGAVPLSLSSENKGLYHLACVFASNHVVALYTCALRTLVRLGIDEPTALRMLAPLTQRTVANIAAQGPVKALTGPIARGDVGTVRQHLRALQGDHELTSAYVALSRLCLDSARAQAKGNEESLEAIAALLNGSG